MTDNELERFEWLLSDLRRGVEQLAQWLENLQAHGKVYPQITKPITGMQGLPWGGDNTIPVTVTSNYPDEPHLVYIHLEGSKKPVKGTETKVEQGTAEIPARHLIGGTNYVLVCQGGVGTTKIFVPHSVAISTRA